MGFEPSGETPGNDAGARPGTPPFIDPSLHTMQNDDTLMLALQQTMAARWVLYHPGGTLRTELAEAAAQLAILIRKLSPDLQRAIGARLLGTQGLLPGGQPEDLLTILDHVAEDAGGGHARAIDRVVVIALMGDIGALFADTGATTGVEGRTAEQARELREELRLLLPGQHLHPPSDDDVKRVQEAGGSKAVGPSKKEERQRPSAELVARTGIHNLGPLADDILHIPPGDALPTTRWEVATILEPRVYDAGEPLVGHMSGSPAEILQVWDMLRGVEAGRQFTRNLSVHPGERNVELRLARAAGAAAFLVGMGYHSAVEVAEGVLAYTGQSLRSVVEKDKDDAGHLLGHGAATDLLIDLFQGQSEYPAPIME